VQLRVPTLTYHVFCAGTGSAGGKWPVWVLGNYVLGLFSMSIHGPLPNARPLTHGMNAATSCAVRLSLDRSVGNAWLAASFFSMPWPMRASRRRAHCLGLRVAALVCGPLRDPLCARLAPGRMLHVCQQLGNEMLVGLCSPVPSSRVRAELFQALAQGGRVARHRQPVLAAPLLECGLWLSGPEREV
jgi:hypothetical protein